MDPFTIAAIAGGLKILGGFSEYNSTKNMLKLQASLYDQNAETALYEGRRNAGKIANAGKYAQSTLVANYGSSGVDVNTSQTVANEQRILQQGVNDDVYTTMYNAATEASQQRINAKMARYQAKQAKRKFIFGSASTAFGSAKDSGLLS